jgi:hypothetical protein
MIGVISKRRSLHGGLGFSQGLKKREAVFWSVSLLPGLSGPDEIDEIDQKDQTDERRVL